MQPRALQRCFAVLALIGCDRHMSAAEKPEVGSASAVSTLMLVGSASGAPALDVSLHVHVASFTADGLNECDDFTLPKEQVDASTAAGFAASLKDAGAVALDQDCETSFTDRPVLASCKLTGPTGGIGVSHFYQAVKLDDDAMMKECLEHHGEWKALSRDDDAYKHSRLRGHANELRRITKETP